MKPVAKVWPPRRAAFPWLGAIVASWGLLGAAVHATPRIPASDSDIVETLPNVSGWSAEQRRLRRELARHPRDEAMALEAAGRYLDLARTQGDARYAGHAMGALRAWDGTPLAQTPPPVLVMRATVAQFLHDFDGAEAALQAALRARPRDPQAWITLATVLRVRGRYAESDAACRALGRVGPALHAVACLAENAALRGRHAEARQALAGLLATPAMAAQDQVDTRQWLWTTLAEVEELAGRPTDAETAYRQALATRRSGYTLLAYSDFLRAHGRSAEIAALLAEEPRSDAVLLRLAVAATGTARHGDSTADAPHRAVPEVDELRARFAASALRPGATAVHAREEAIFALDVQHDAGRALALARINLQRQREPVDFLLCARAAVAAQDRATREEVAALMRQIGLRDARVEALL